MRLTDRILSMDDLKDLVEKVKKSQPQPPSFMSTSQVQSSRGYTTAVQLTQQRLWADIEARMAMAHSPVPVEEFAHELRDKLGRELMPGVEGRTLMCSIHIETGQFPAVVIQDIFGCGEAISSRDIQTASVGLHAQRIRRRWREMLVEPPEGSEETLPHLTEAVGFRIGFRSWNRGPERAFFEPMPITAIDPDENVADIQCQHGSTLVSGFRYSVWEPRKATVLNGPGVGFFARKAVPDFVNYGLINGLVALWGDVYEHEHGYRASHAYPYAIIGERGVADLYGVPCITWEQAEAML